MSEMLDQAEVEAALTHAETGVAGLLGLGLERCSDSDILTLWRRLEAGCDSLKWPRLGPE